MCGEVGGQKLTPWLEDTTLSTVSNVDDLAILDGPEECLRQISSDFPASSSPSSDDDYGIDFRFRPSRLEQSERPRGLSQEKQQLWAEIDEKCEAQRLQRRSLQQQQEANSAFAATRSQSREPIAAGSSPELRFSRPPRIVTPGSCTLKDNINVLRQPSSASLQSEASGDFVLTPQTSKSHVDLWSTANETVIIFDWDDTLCPTTFIWDDPRLKWSEVAPCFTEPISPQESCAGCRKRSRMPSIPSGSDLVDLGDSEASPQRLDPWEAATEELSLLQILDEHQNAVLALLRLAVSLGQVVIVTLAQVGWVETSVKNFMPKLAGFLEENDIEVVYARQSIPSRYLRRAREEENELQKVLKTRAMSQTIKKFYSRGSSDPAGRSWKNVISVGDSAAERLALQDVIMRRVQRDSRGAPKECRCKVVKLLLEPSCERLTAEVQVLINWLLTIVCQDDDLDIDFSDMEMEEDPNSPTGLSPTWARRRNRFSGDSSADGSAAGSAEGSANGGSPSSVPWARDSGYNASDQLKDVTSSQKMNFSDLRRGSDHSPPKNFRQFRAETEELAAFEKESGELNA